MESEPPSYPSVKRFDEENSDDVSEVKPSFPGTIPDLECAELCRRFDGYLKGMFRNNLPCVLAAEFKRRFKKKTGLSWRHIDDIFPTFQKWSTNFRFKKQRLGRSTCIVITLRYRPLVLTTAECRRRLVGAIRNHVAKSNRAHVDRKFLENFHSLTGLPAEQIFYAWRTLRRIEGCSCRWRGRGNGVNFYVEPSKAGQVSHPENASGISPLPGGKEMKTRSPLAPRFPDRSSGGRWPLQGGVGEDRARLSPPEPGEEGQESTAPRPGSSPGGDFHRPSGLPRSEVNRSNRLGNDRVIARWKPARPPLHVGGRWIAAARILSKANFLAFGPLQHLHATFFRVRFGPMHARNFCEEALRAGFLDSEICAAYRVGLEETQKSATRDWRTDISFDGIREPSQAVARAWLRLRADGRTDEQRWLAIFRGEVAPQLRSAGPRADSGAEGLRETVTSPASPAIAPSRSDYRQSAPGLRVRSDESQAELAQRRAAAKLPDPAPALIRVASRAHFSGSPTFENFLRMRKVTMPELLKLSRAEQQKFVREMHAWQKNSEPT